MVHGRNCKVRMVGRFLLRNILAVGDILWAYFSKFKGSRNHVQVCFFSPTAESFGVSAKIAPGLGPRVSKVPSKGSGRLRGSNSGFQVL